MSIQHILIALVLVIAFPLACEIECAHAADPLDAAKLHWKALPDLPNELGVAGPFVGVHGDALIVAGGANFPQPVWETQKVWTDQIWVLPKTDSGMQWRSGGLLPRPIAYGAAVSTSRGVVCIGGNDANQLYRDVFVLQWNAAEQRVACRELPSLPSPFAYGQATLIGDVIYVAGGQSGLKLETAMNNFWALDLSQQDDSGDFRWRVLPAIPTARAFNITTHQNNGELDCVYVLGGRHEVNGEVRFLRDVLEFNPRTTTWRPRADLPRSVCAGCGIGFGPHQIFVLTGDDGSLFAKTDELKDQHPGFRKEAFAYNTLTNTWTSAGATPQNQVTTLPAIWNDRIIIASGEIRPRVRTPKVWSIGLSEM